jgi:hypothetical protein
MKRVMIETATLDKNSVAGHSNSSVDASWNWGVQRHVNHDAGRNPGVNASANAACTVWQRASRVVPKS